jgi:hypothetical protein
LNTFTRTFLSAVLLVLAISACSGSRQASPVPLAAQAGAGSRVVKDSAGAGMCSVYSGFGGTLSFCYNFDEASGTTLVDSVRAPATITVRFPRAASAYQVPGLTSNSSYAETTNGSTRLDDQRIFVPAGGVVQRVVLRRPSLERRTITGPACGDAAIRLITGGASTGLNISVNSILDGNQIYVVFAKFGYGSGRGNDDLGTFPLRSILMRTSR